MAGIAYVKKRLYNPEILIDANEIFGTHGQILRRAEGGHYKPMYYINWTGTTQAGEELGTAAASVKDGTTTPFQVTVVSSDVADNRSTAAGAVHSVALVGVSTNSVAGYAAWNEDPTTTEGDLGKPRATVEVVAMNGTTDVLSTRYYLWLDAVYACEWGTGATDATGNITAESPANTTLIQITAGQNEGEGGVWHFPPNHYIDTHHVGVVPTATFAAGDGVVLSGTFTGFDQSNNTDPDLNVDYYTYTSRGGSIANTAADHTISRYTTTNSKVLWSEALIANAIVFNLHIVQIMDE
jgi:hypothetical protein